MSFVTASFFNFGACGLGFVVWFYYRTQTSKVEH